MAGDGAPTTGDWPVVRAVVMGPGVVTCGNSQGSLEASSWSVIAIGW